MIIVCAYYLKLLHINWYYLIIGNYDNIFSPIQNNFTDVKLAKFTNIRNIERSNSQYVN